MTTVDKLSPSRGRAAELLISAQLLPIGVVSFPLMQTPAYDLILDVGGHLWKIQVKQAQYIPQRVRKHGKGDRACWRVDLTGKKKTGHVHQYSVASFDVLAIVCTPALVYYIPVAKLRGTEGRLLRHVTLKVLDETVTRKDAIEALERWERYRDSILGAIATEHTYQS